MRSHLFNGLCKERLSESRTGRQEGEAMFQAVSFWIKGNSLFLLFLHQIQRDRYLSSIILSKAHTCGGKQSEQALSSSEAGNSVTWQRHILLVSSPLVVSNWPDLTQALPATVPAVPSQIPLSWEKPAHTKGSPRGAKISLAACPESLEQSCPVGSRTRSTGKKERKTAINGVSKKKPFCSYWLMTHLARGKSFTSEESLLSTFVNFPLAVSRSQAWVAL